MDRKGRYYNPATKEPVYEEVRYYDTLSHTCTLTKNRCCAPLPRDSLRLDGEHDCRRCNVPVLFSLKGIGDDLVGIHDVILWKAGEKE